VITCFFGIAMMPWKLLANHKPSSSEWLGGYAAVLGPGGRIMICDTISSAMDASRSTTLSSQWRIRIRWGIQLAGNRRVVRGHCGCTGGISSPSIRFLYDYSWFVGFAVAFWDLLRVDEEIRRYDFTADFASNSSLLHCGLFPRASCSCRQLIGARPRINRSMVIHPGTGRPARIDYNLRTLLR